VVDGYLAIVSFDCEAQALSHREPFIVLLMAMPHREERDCGGTQVASFWPLMPSQGEMSAMEY